ncbi:MAG: RHS repeat-associated core domain-containing protein [Chitinispirillaceae bacterium]|jgi:RHS repeat-associated protein
MYQTAKSSWPLKSKGRGPYGFYKFRASVPLLLCAFALIYSQTTPNYTETIIYNIDGNNNNTKNRTYTDGLGREIQTQTLKGSDAIITGKTYDEVGRLSKTSMPFKQTSNPNLDYNTGDIIQQAIAAWPKGAGYDSAYSSVQYYCDPLDQPYATGAPGDSFALSKHAAKSWTFGVTGGANPSTDFEEHGFIKPLLLDTTSLNTTIPTDLEAYETSNPGSKKYFLSVSMDQNGHFIQTLKDLFDNKLRTASSANGTSLIISTQSYDILGNMLSEMPPQTVGKEVKSDTNQYNTTGQVLQKTTPEANTVFLQYNKVDQLTSVIDSNCRSVNKVWDSIIYRYDQMGRCVLSAEVFDNDVMGPRVRTIYDDTTGLRQYLKTCNGFPTEPDLTTLLSSLTNTQGRVVAEIGYDENLKYSEPDEPTYAGKVIRLFSYDDNGKVIAKYTSIPGMADLQKMFYTYDIHDKVLIVTYQIGSQSADIVYAYAYDALGKVDTIKNNGTAFVTYVYDDYNRLTQKTFTVGGVNYPVTYTYSIRGWVKKIDANNHQFIEELCYEENELGTASGFIPQYNGNISRIKDTCKPYTPTDILYSYDKIDRLTNANNIQNPDSDDYDGTYSYLDDGRILQKHEGDTAHRGWGDYTYKAGTNELIEIKTSTKQATTGGNPNYIYDFNGNMVFDQSKKMTVEYDWRNMPIRFNIYDTIPDDVATWDDVKSLVSNTSVHRLHEIVMTYDAQGNRVKKEVVDPTLGTCPDTNTGDSSGNITNIITGTTYKFKNNGSLQTCKTISNDMSNPDTDALMWQVNEISQIAFNSNRLQISGSLIENNATPESGNLQLSYEPDSAPKFVADQVSGNLEEAGQTTGRSIIYGVAYLDGGRIFVYNSSNLAYNLSYTASAEGVVRSDGSIEVYVKDHLGSTRAVVYGTGQLKEAIAYYAYGMEQPLFSPPQDARARMKFTGKEFDGDAYINLTYFGARYYDPETGVWLTCDPKHQLCNPYAYSANPISFVDPDGKYIIGAIIGALAGAYVGGALANGSFNLGNWDWNKFGTWSGMILGGIAGGKIGSSIENNMWDKYWSTGKGESSFGSRYGQGVFKQLLQQKYIPQWSALGSAATDQEADVWILNERNAVYGAGHVGAIVGDPELGYYYSSLEDINFGAHNPSVFADWEDPKIQRMVCQRYTGFIHISTTIEQDIKMLDFASDNYLSTFHIFHNNCGDFVGGMLRAGGLPGYTGAITIPNVQFGRLQPFFQLNFGN